jgi:hypothetical protein
MALRHAVQSFEGVLRSQHRVYDGRGEVARTQNVWGAEGISGRVKFLLLAYFNGCFGDFCATSRAYEFTQNSGKKVNQDQI